MKLISDTYAQQNAALHAEAKGFGMIGHQFANNVRLLCLDNKYTSVLDYGAGKGRLKQELDGMESGLTMTEYDPGITEKSVLPEPADLVVCFDVLEHVEPEFLDNVLTHIRDLSRHCTMLSISNIESSRTLDDGRNAHLTIEDHPWWQDRLRPFFDIVHD